VIDECKKLQEQRGIDKQELLNVYQAAQKQYEDEIQITLIPADYRDMYYKRAREIGLSAMRDYAWFEGTPKYIE